MPETRLEDLAHDLVALSEENSARADRLINKLRRDRRAAADLATRKAKLLRDKRSRKGLDQSER